MEFAYGIHEQSGYSEGCELRWKGTEVDALGESIDHDHDHREAVGVGEVSYEIHRKILPNSGRDGNWL